MADGRKNNGGFREGSGRKPKAEIQELIEKMSPYDDDILDVLVQNAIAGKPWAVRLYMAYRYGKPRETKEIQLEQPEQPIFNIGILGPDGGDL